MIQFKQRRINEAFVKECEEVLLDGGSAVLLGPRFGGKRFIQERLLKVIPKRLHTPIIWFSVIGGNRPADLEGIHYQILDPRVEGPPRSATGNPTQEISALVNGQEQPVVLLATNVDSLPQEAARAFLRQVRVLVEQRRVAAILSGELDFRDLVHGVHSEFNCAEQFVLQGFDRDTFHEEFLAYTLASRVTWQNSAEAEERVWEITKGNSHITRLLIAVADDLRRRGIPEMDGAEINDAVLERALQPEVVPTAYWTGVLRRPVDLIAAEPECSEDVETLITKGSVRARSLDGSPGVLELSGIGIRDGSAIRFSSEFMERLTKRHLTPRRMADLYAQSGDWNRAFERYSKLDEIDCVRPSDGDDRRAVQVVLQALGSAMFAASRQGPKEVNELLASGVEYLLGFSEVSFWIHRGTWQQVAGDRPLSPSSARSLAEVLPYPSSDIGVLSLPESVGRFAVAAGLRDGTIVALSGLGSRRVVSRERMLLAQKLLQCFVQAHDQAVQAEFNATRLKARDRHVKILNGIFDVLGGQVFDVEQILALTGNELLTLGYRRAMFSLVDSKKERIDGVLDCSTDVSVKLSQMTHYSLLEPPVDIQQYVIWSARSICVKDASKEQLVNPEARKAADLRSFAIVPILDRFEKAIGTIHIEREDGEVPTQQEVEDLELFGRQLARILALHERMTLIQRCLDGSTEPLMITNTQTDVVYANKTAAGLFDIEIGWQDTPRVLFPSGSKIGTALAEALTGHRAVRQIRELGNNPSYRGEVVCDSLKDWRRQTLGAFVDVHDLESDLTRRALARLGSRPELLDALTNVSEAPDFEAAQEAIMDAFASFGYKEVRMYIVNSKTGLLTSHRARGLPSEQLAMFQSGGVVLPPRDASGHAWLSLDNNQATLFYFGDPDEPVRAGIKYSESGLEALALPKPNFPPEFPRERGAYWLSLPLYLGESPFGKITIMCDGQLEPEVLESMKFLAARTSELLLKRQDGEKREKAKNEAMRAGLETSMSAVAHNLGSRLAALPIILERYKRREARCSDLREVNEDFRVLIDHAMATIKRTRELLGKISVRYQQCNLNEMLHRVLHSSLEEGQYRLDANAAVVIEADPHLLEAALVELIQNSKQFAIDPSLLRVQAGLKVCEKRRRALIEFSDNGPGVPDEYKKRIFDEFFAHRPGRERSTGLGLAFVRRTVHAHGGEIDEDGKPGNGVHFRLDLPLHKGS